jgi:hypothetical protein
MTLQIPRAALRALPCNHRGAAAPWRLAGAPAAMMECAS